MKECRDCRELLWEKKDEHRNSWVMDVTEEMGWDDPVQGLHALEGVLHALRDHMPMQSALELGARLDFGLKGIYYEGWVPLSGSRALAPECKKSFMEEVMCAFPEEPEREAKAVVRGVLKVIAQNIADEEIEQFTALLPFEVEEIWKEAVVSQWV